MNCYKGRCASFSPSLPSSPFSCCSRLAATALVRPPTIRSCARSLSSSLGWSLTSRRVDAGSWTRSGISGARRRGIHAGRPSPQTTTIRGATRLAAHVSRRARSRPAVRTSWVVRRNAKMVSTASFHAMKVARTGCTAPCSTDVYMTSDQRNNGSTTQR